MRVYWRRTCWTGPKVAPRVLVSVSCLIFIDRRSTKFAAQRGVGALVFEVICGAAPSLMRSGC